MILSKEQLAALDDKELAKRKKYLENTLTISPQDIKAIEAIDIDVTGFLFNVHRFIDPDLLEDFQAKMFNPNRFLSEDASEYLASVLVDDIKDQLTGPDLTRFEVKKFNKKRNRAEYKSSRNCGLRSIENLHNVNHIFMEYSNGYKTITVYVACGSTLKPLFDVWAELFKRDHAINGHIKNHNWRTAIPGATLKRCGHIVFHMENTQVVQPVIPSSVLFTVVEWLKEDYRRKLANVENRVGLQQHLLATAA